MTTAASNPIQIAFDSFHSHTGDPHKINDMYTSRYARMLAADPKFADLFNFRRLKAL